MQIDTSKVAICHHTTVAEHGHEPTGHDRIAYDNNIIPQSDAMLPDWAKTSSCM